MFVNDFFPSDKEGNRTGEALISASPAEKQFTNGFTGAFQSQRETVLVPPASFTGNLGGNAFPLRTASGLETPAAYTGILPNDKLPLSRSPNIYKKMGVLTDDRL